MQMRFIPWLILEIKSTKKFRKFKVPNESPFVSTNGQSGPTSRPAFPEATRVIIIMKQELAFKKVCGRLTWS